MKSRSDLPMYAQYDSVTLTKEQFRALCKNRNLGPWKHSFNETIRVAQTKDGKAWASKKGDTVFWVQRWYEIPRIVYARAKKFMEGIENL